MKEEKREERVGVRLTRREKVRLKQLAGDEDRTLSQEVRRALRAYLESEEKKRKEE